MLLKKMKYDPVKQRSQEEVEEAILRNDPEELLDAVLAAALHSDEPHWSERICLLLSNHSHFNVRGNAILGFAHIARLHGRLNENKVKPVIEAALNDESDYVRGQANAAADDVEFFLKWKVARYV